MCRCLMNLLRPNCFGATARGVYCRPLRSAPDWSNIIEAAWQIKVTARSRSIIRAHGNGRCHPPAEPRRIWDPGNGIDAHTAADSLAAVRLLALGAANGAGDSWGGGRVTGGRLARNGVIARLDIAGLNLFARTKSNGRSKASGRNKDIAEIHLMPKRFANALLPVW
jgi:hypothetical protein